MDTLWHEGEKDTANKQIQKEVVNVNLCTHSNIFENLDKMNNVQRSI
jgi:hypothetical protein